MRNADEPIMQIYCNASNRLQKRNLLRRLEKNVFG